MTAIVTQQNKIDLESIFNGDLAIIQDESSSLALREFCLDCIHQSFGSDFDPRLPMAINKDDFVSKATQAKKKFTNHRITTELLEALIANRYEAYLMHKLYYDVPRVRLIPNSCFINSGVSYNYQPHRDTWYGAGQGQINHWIAVENVTKDSTFFVAPSFFSEPIPNSSQTFDLDVWDMTYRPLAASNTTSEDRPHPLPDIHIPDSRKLAIVVAKGQELCFSGHHLHGSLPNTTSKLRISIDFRVEIDSRSLTEPINIDNRSTGCYRKYMIQHPRFGL